MKLSREEAIQAWLEAAVLAASNPEDHAARQTQVDLACILAEQHGIEGVRWGRVGGGYEVTCTSEAGVSQHTFTAEQAERLREQLQSDPRYGCP